MTMMGSGDDWDRNDRWNDPSENSFGVGGPQVKDQFASPRYIDIADWLETLLISNSGDNDEDILFIRRLSIKRALAEIKRLRDTRGEANHD